MRPLKCALKRAAGKTFAEDCLANPGDFSIAVGLAANRPKLLMWLHYAMEFVMQRESIHNIGWLRSGNEGGKGAWDSFSSMERGDYSGIGRHTLHYRYRCRKKSVLWLAYVNGRTFENAQTIAGLQQPLRGWGQDREEVGFHHPQFGGVSGHPRVPPKYRMIVGCLRRCTSQFDSKNIRELTTRRLSKFNYIGHSARRLRERWP
eukprot:3556254-Amphidinium_carterae.1